MLTHFFSADDLSTPLHKHDKKSVRQFLQFHRTAMAEEDALAWFKLERTEAVFDCC